MAERYDIQEALLKKYEGDTHTVLIIIEDMVNEVLAGADPEDILYNEGLEPDYVFSLLEYAR